MRMKAQSELVGDHKSRAEMTRPRSHGATNWINGVSDMMSKIQFNASDFISHLNMPEVEFLPAFKETLSTISDIKLENEVSYRPADQQCSVCTP